MAVLGNKSNTVSILLAFIVPAIVVWLATQLQFWSGAVIANPVGIILAIGSGIWLATHIRFEKQGNKILFWLGYLAILIVGVLFIALITSCANGDCI